MLRKTLRLKFYFLKVIRFHHPHYDSNIIGDILKNVQGNKYVCLNETIMINHSKDETENEK